MIEFLNYIAISIVAMILVAFIVALYSYDTDYFIKAIIAVAFVFPLLAISSLFNYKGNYFLCGIIINISLTVLFFVLSGVLFGKQAGLHYYFLLFALIPLFTYKSDRKLIILVSMAINILCFSYVDFIKPANDWLLSFPSSMAGPFRIATIVIFFVSSLLIVVTNQYFLKCNEKMMKKQSEQITLQNEELSELINVKNRFFSVVAKDLKGPVGTVSSFLDYLADSAADLNYTQFHESLDVLKRYSQDIYGLLDNLLTWSRIQSGDISFDRQRHNLTELIDSTVKSFNVKIKEKNLKIVNEIEGSDYIVPFDKEMVCTVLRNIIDNSVKYSRQDGVIKIGVDKFDDYLKISISDNGIGMDSFVLDSLFEIEMVQTNHLMKNDIKGNRLGLILCKEFVERHGGTLTVNSNTDKGTDISFTLPLD